MVLQPLHAVVTQHEPQLERPETASQRHLPVPVVEHRAARRRLVQQVLGQDGQGVDQGSAVGYPEAGAIEVGEHPFVGIETVTVGVFDTVMQVMVFRADDGRAGHGGIHVEPQALHSADPPDIRNRVERVG